MTPETDLSAYVVKLLDEHIDAMQRLRAEMRMRATTRPGARYVLALDGIRAAQEFSGRLLAAVPPSPTQTAG
ncbi:hypothetical protein [Actinoplanes subtropicus]|uniref:hypothetical protein n=1 Tax=Actinoplanes subtropicus TaxID=543632 RepID=UPI0004C441D8|nr:hypothetical protein [Actinoplanes subtropicus]